MLHQYAVKFSLHWPTNVIPVHHSAFQRRYQSMQQKPLKQTRMERLKISVKTARPKTGKLEVLKWRHNHSQSPVFGLAVLYPAGSEISRFWCIKKRGREIAIESIFFFLLYLSVHCGDLISQIKKISAVIYTLTEVAAECRQQTQRSYELKIGNLKTGREGRRSIQCRYIQVWLYVKTLNQ